MAKHSHPIFVYIFLFHLPSHSDGRHQALYSIELPSGVVWLLELVLYQERGCCDNKISCSRFERATISGRGNDDSMNAIASDDVFIECFQQTRRVRSLISRVKQFMLPLESGSFEYLTVNFSYDFTDSHTLRLWGRDRVSSSLVACACKDDHIILERSDCADTEQGVCAEDHLFASRYGHMCVQVDM